MTAPDNNTLGPISMLEKALGVGALFLFGAILTGHAATAGHIAGEGFNNAHTAFSAAYGTVFQDRGVGAPDGGAPAPEMLGSPIGPNGTIRLPNGQVASQ
jgi:hypothetical protein